LDLPNASIIAFVFSCGNSLKMDGAPFGNIFLISSSFITLTGGSLKGYFDEGLILENRYAGKYFPNMLSL